MNTLLSETPALATANASAADVLDLWLGVQAGDGLDLLRRFRPVTRAQSQKSHEALFAPLAPLTAQVSPAERHAVAAFVAQLHGVEPAAAAHFAQLEEVAPALVVSVLAAAQDGQTQGPYGDYPAGPLTAENQAGLQWRLPAALAIAVGRRLAAALEHAHFLVFHPRDATAARLLALEQAGWSTDDTVVLSQLVSFLTYQLRVVVGLQVLGTHWDGDLVQPSLAVPPQTAAQPSSTAVQPEQPGSTPKVFTQSPLDWLPWLEPLPEAALTARHLEGLVDAARAKSDYFRLLARDPDVLGARTRTDKDIFYNTAGGLARAERELAAAATSRLNGCIYCASVHARFASHFSQRPADVQQLLDQGVDSVQEPRWQAIVQASVALSHTPSQLSGAHIAKLQAQGLDRASIADVLHAAAFFNWANRLMLSLGEPRLP